MDPDMECHYKNLLHQWKNDEDTVKDELKKLDPTLKNLARALKKLVPT